MRQVAAYNAQQRCKTFLSVRTQVEARARITVEFSQVDRVALEASG